MTVYRIQSKQDRTRGAYRSHIYGNDKPYIVKKLEAAHGFDGDRENHPTPDMDVEIGRCIERNEYCGFACATDLLRWFRGFIPDLLRAGYEIVALRDVMITAIGEHQVIFTWSD